MSSSRIALIVIGAVLLAQAAMAPRCMGFKEKDTCSGKYKGRLKPSPEELEDILKKHAAWLKDLHNSKLASDPRRANLCDAYLIDTQLHGADLEYADLHGALLIGADLRGTNLYAADLRRADLGAAHLTAADLRHADMEGARLPAADLTGANLTVADLIDAGLGGAYLNKAQLGGTDLTNAELGGASLIGADLNDADLRGAHLTNADLDNAYLHGADLTDADLDGAHLAGADLMDANVAGADLNIVPDSMPKVTGIYEARNLQLVKFRDQPAGLFKLRGEFKDMGMRTQEAQLTYAIRRSELRRRKSYYPDGPYVHGWSERYFNTVFFDWTCQYGMSPGRPILIVAALAVLLSFAYVFAQINPGPNGGIWAVWDEHRIKQAEGSKEPRQLTDGFPCGRSEIGVLLLALYFSLLSATRIGWRDFNVGTWITRIQPHQYSLQATGWVRVVSGIQSLISVYLVALAILTYFGTPFEY